MSPMRPEGSVRIAALHGEIDYDELDLLRGALMPEGESVPPVVADMSGVIFLDSSGTDVLVALHQQVSDAKDRMRIVAPTTSVRRVPAASTPSSPATPPSKTPWAPARTPTRSRRGGCPRRSRDGRPLSALAVGRERRRSGRGGRCGVVLDVGAVRAAPRLPDQDLSGRSCCSLG
ncbi:STAS domain-containing protein [Streptomyces sp. NPDC013012]|uniref:STAS domain-containing protein n=1 Tax=Streptomyces sp. NPDC013012 TaxID=3364860 RepID=UPI003677BA55